MRVHSIPVLGLLAALSGCRDAPGPITTDTARPPVGAQQPVDVDVQGTVQWSDLEGGFWAIRGDDGVTYDTQGGVPEEFREEGLRVRLRAREIRDAVSFRMVGPIVEIVELTRL